MWPAWTRLAFLLLVLLLSEFGVAFPSHENSFRAVQHASRHADSHAVASKLRDSLRKLERKRSSSNPLSQPIDVTGAHAFQPPNFAQGDQRGPCPGLNALANHGYIPRNGVVGFAELITAVNQVYGMGIDLATILAVMGTVGVGDPLSLNPGFSIGGKTPAVANVLDNLLGLLGTPRGLDGSHNWIEADSSNTRDDLYVTGDSWTMNLTLFQQAYNAIPGGDDAVITMDDLFARAATRFGQSVATNAYFYYGPYTGFVARNAGYIFAGRLLGNHSATAPDGQLTKGIFKSFWGITSTTTASGEQLSYSRGCERIPDNWYRAPVDYGMLPLQIDLVDLLLQYPILASIGGNLGAVNTFTGVDLGDVTGGALNAGTLLEGNNLICFAIQAVKTLAPNSLSSLFSLLDVPLQLVDQAVLGPLLNLSCPAWGDLTMDGGDLFSGLVKKYPGAKKSNAGF